MKRGRVSILTLLVILGLVALGAILAFSSTSDSPESVSIRFLDGLARGDAKVLSETSFLDDVTQDELLKRWQETCDYNKYYQFMWTMKSSQAVTDKTAVTTVTIRALGANEADYRLPLVKHDGKWVVDIGVVDRSFFPSLPKP